MNACSLEIVDVVIQGVIGVATVAAVAIALWQVRSDKRVREDTENRSQAEQISSWFEHLEDCGDYPKDSRFVWQCVLLRNNSEAPVYDVVLTCVGVRGAGPAPKGENNGSDYPCRCCVKILPPGEWMVWLPTNGSGMHVVLAPEMAFTDARGLSWVRRGDGALKGISKIPEEFYSLLQPVSWGSCVRVERWPR